MEPLDEQRGEPDERRTGDRRRSHDRGRDRRELHARLEPLAARVAPVLAALDADRGREDRPQAHAAPTLRLDHGSRERRQGGRPGRRRNGPIAPEPDTVLDALAEPAEPAVQRREVERPEARRRTPEPLRRLEVPLRRGRDDRDGVGLSRHEVGRQDADAAPARAAARERNGHARRLGRGVIAGEDRASRDPRPRETKARCATARTRRQAEPVRYRVAALTKVGEERTMHER